MIELFTYRCKTCNDLEFYQEQLDKDPWGPLSLYECLSCGENELVFAGMFIPHE